MPIEISKLDAARRQLVTAIRLYFASGDEVSIHTLTMAAYEILETFARASGHSYESLRGGLLKSYAPKSKVNEAQSFFKHADRDPFATLNFRSEGTEWFLLDACRLYDELVPDRVDEMRIFEWWAFSHFAKETVPASEWDRCFRAADGHKLSLSRAPFFAYWMQTKARA